MKNIRIFAKTIEDTANQQIELISENKAFEEIIEQIKDTVAIKDIIKPIYNFKGE